MERASRGPISRGDQFGVIGQGCARSIASHASRLQAIHRLQFSQRHGFYEVIAALAQNEIGSATLETTGIPSEIGFSSDEHGVFVTSAFMTDPWADFDEHERVLVARDPESGVDMVVALPSAMVGPHARRLTDTMQFVDDVAHRRIPLDPGFHFNFVDVRDVASKAAGDALAEAMAMAAE